RVVRAYSHDMDAEGSFDLAAPGRPRNNVWLDYVEGVARALEAEGLASGGADLLITSEVPRGAGLSSSAALELAVALALVSLSGSPPPARQLARIGQRAEHEFVGVNCGIMDQMVSALARAEHALLIDCRSLQTTNVALPLAGHQLLLCDTGVR